ncbi:MAG: hypothetical protein WC829_02685 [Hyphomicrobium sp.]
MIAVKITPHEDGVRCGECEGFPILGGMCVWTNGPRLQARQQDAVLPPHVAGGDRHRREGRARGQEGGKDRTDGLAAPEG